VTAVRTVRRRGYCRAASDRAPRRNMVLAGDALTRLKSLPTASVDCVVTSPPYFLLRDYAQDGQLGLEPDVGDYVDRLVAMSDELARVLKPAGSFWLNLGDSYSRHPRYGAPPKSLLLAPERVALALVERGWVLRNKIVWAKPNPMPHSVTDRLNCGWEYLFHFVRTCRYFYDLDAIREPHRSGRKVLTAPARHAKAKTGTLKYDGRKPDWAGPLAGNNSGLVRARAEGRAGHALGKNPGDVWTIPTAGYHGAHFAVFPERLIERPLRATCPARVCASCGNAWTQSRGVATAPMCACNAGSRPGLVLDPFMGTGTTALVAQQLGRDWLGIELSADYRALARERIAVATTA